jgi:hypothetical protein
MDAKSVRSGPACQLIWTMTIVLRTPFPILVLLTLLVVGTLGCAAEEARDPVVAPAAAPTAAVATKAVDASTGTKTPLQFEPFAPDSPLNLPIPAAAAVDPRSPAMIAGLVESGADERFVLSIGEWTMPVYFADADTPRHSVELTADWAEGRQFHDVPIPANALPDAEDDGHLVIVDLDSGCEYDFWQMRRDGDRWVASWGNSARLDGSGILPRGASARGSGFAALAGLVWPDELAAGRIEHALVFSYDFPKAGGPVAPATESDGESTHPGAIPEGGRLRLNPDLDLDALGLTGYQRTIAETLQRYGMYLVDLGGGVQIYALHRQSLDADPYSDPMIDGPYVSLIDIPLDQFEVMELPEQIADPDLGPVSDGCGYFE